MKKIIILLVVLFKLLNAEEPYWYNNPSIDNKIVSTGISSNVYIEVAYENAMRNALVELGRFLKTNIKGIDKSRESFSNNNYSIEYSSDTITETDTILDLVVLENIARVGHTTYVRISIDGDFIDNFDNSINNNSYASSLINAINDLEKEKINKIKEVEFVFKERYKRGLNAIERYKISKIIDIENYPIDNIIGYITSSNL